MTLRAADLPDDVRARLGLGSSKPAKPGKYGAERTTVDGITFDSKKESTVYLKLKMLRAARKVIWFCRQGVFDLPGGVRYRCDFVVVWADGRTEAIDVKGMRTREYINKAKQVKAVCGVEIREW